MKRAILFFLLSAGTASVLHAQERGFSYGRTYPSRMTEWNFNYPSPGKTKVVFSFYNVYKSARVMLELSNIKQMEHLPNLDSMLTIVKSKLQYLGDSLKQDGIARRIDYVILGNKATPQIRITNHSDNSKTYTIINNELNDLKMEQDTLRIKYYALGGDSVRMWVDGKMQKKQRNDPFFITITVNNISDINTLPELILQGCLNTLREAVTADYVRKAKVNSNYHASFNMLSNKMFSPANIKYIKYGGERQEFVPNIYSSLQFAKGTFVPSMGAGLRYTFANRSFTTTRLYAMWEPHFFFSRDAANKLITDRNDFITLRIIQIEKDNKNGFDFAPNFSFGYLVKRRGDWFEPKTFKLGIPAIRSGWLQLEPEFFFTGLVRNFSPSLKLTLHYE